MHDLVDQIYTISRTYREVRRENVPEVDAYAETAKRTGTTRAQVKAAVLAHDYGAMRRGNK